MHSRTCRNVLVFLFILLCNSVLCVVVSWGESCKFTDECGDHRLVCEKIIVDNETTQVCVCDRYHEWNGTSVGCVQTVSTAEILGMLQEKYNISERIEYEANLVFVAQITAGLIVMTVGLVCTLTVGVYCYWMSHQDTKLEEMVKRMESQRVSRHRPATSRGLT